ncbi:hypothetical protein SB00610_05049 [Klebsiella quasipneumoniae subsp. similipneumoniae]|nr:hypothetical protein SB00610_05049 [Klebsiella quasipneumoniae subsp. similipneumoniae]
MAGLRLSISIGNGRDAWSSSLAAWRSVVSIHSGSSGRKTTIRFTAASSRRETPSNGSMTGRFAALCISWLNPRAASEQGERMYSVIIDRQR